MVIINVAFAPKLNLSAFSFSVFVFDVTKMTFRKFLYNHCHRMLLFTQCLASRMLSSSFDAFCFIFVHPIPV